MVNVFSLFLGFLKWFVKTDYIMINFSQLKFILLMVVQRLKLFP